ncbi:hypothetical protein LWM68_45090 [Niabella sp. W65]|nr:hypothetical protein [Niabella sp. W65]MCH7369280.1 hypothetical protein [Niabella sp. W65]
MQGLLNSLFFFGSLFLFFFKRVRRFRPVILAVFPPSHLMLFHHPHLPVSFFLKGLGGGGGFLGPSLFASDLLPFSSFTLLFHCLSLRVPLFCYMSFVLSLPEISLGTAESAHIFFFFFHRALLLFLFRWKKPLQISQVFLLFLFSWQI